MTWPALSWIYSWVRRAFTESMAILFCGYLARSKQILTLLSESGYKVNTLFYLANLNVFICLMALVHRARATYYGGNANALKKPSFSAKRNGFDLGTVQ